MFFHEHFSCPKPFIRKTFRTLLIFIEGRMPQDVGVHSDSYLNHLRVLKGGYELKNRNSIFYFLCTSNINLPFAFRDDALILWLPHKK